MFIWRKSYRLLTVTICYSSWVSGFHKFHSLKPEDYVQKDVLITMAVRMVDQNRVD